jgi:hypothetical protein
MLEHHAHDVFSLGRPFHILGADLRTRMTVLRHEGDLLLHSPVPLDDALAAELDALGTVRWIVAPNDMHHLYAQAAKARYPGAELVATPAAIAKGVPADRPLTDAAEDWRGWLDTVFVDGMPRLNETALFHRSSGTLVLADFLFNHTDGGWYTRAFLSMAGAHGGPRQSRLLRSLVKDRPAVRRSRDQLLELPIDRITVCHGHVLEDDAREGFAEAAAWLG